MASTHKGILRAKRIGNSCKQFFLHDLFAETLVTCVHHDDEEMCMS